MIVLIFFFVFFLLFIPIPFKFKFGFTNKQPYFYFYKWNINLFSFSRKRSIKPTNKIFKKRKKKYSINYFLKKLQKNRFKPHIFLKTNITYSFDDAALTAIFYGVLHSVFSSISKGLKTVFTLRNHEYSISAQYTNLTLDIKIESIIYASLAKIIYIVCILL